LPHRFRVRIFKSEELPRWSRSSRQATSAALWPKHGAGAGRSIFLGVRNLQNQKVLALIGGGPLITAHTLAEAVRDAGTVPFAIPPNALRKILDNLGDLKGKVLIDATNSGRTRAGEFASVADVL
jgi:predicted dinucleotide-binding enzyme